MTENPSDSENVVANDANILSFIIRVWREEKTSKEQEAVWRGHITPIPDGKRRYFLNIKEIPDLILAHLNLQK